MAASAHRQTAFVLERRLLSLHEFDLMKEAGIFTEDDRIELLDGELLAMRAASGRHSGCIVRCDRQLQRGVDPILLVSVQNPLRIGGRTEFVPDLIVYRGDEMSNDIPLAEQVLVVIEVADSSRNYDRAIKAARYAGAGIPELILVDLVDDRMIGYSEPRMDGYRRTLVAGRGERLPSAILPGFVFDVDTILGVATSER